MEPVNSGYINVLMNQLAASKKRRTLQQDAASSLLGQSQPTGGGNAAPVTVGGNLGGWISQAAKAMGRQFSPQEMSALQTMIQKESGGNPNAVNNWDSNAKKGTPSKGLMQTIQPTFNAYKMAGYDNILDPVANIIAGVRYAEKRYGNLLNVPGIKAMNSGQAYRGY